MPSNTTPPSNWPANVTYLATPHPSRLLPPALRLAYCSPSPSTSLPNPPPRLHIRKIDDPTHPACGQSGLFNATGKPIPRATFLRDYTGLVHLEREADQDSDYDLSLERIRTGDGDGEWDVVGIDATKMGAEARFVNDFRGTGAPRPNAVFQLREWQLPNGKGTAKRMAIFAGPHGIDKNAEVVVSYGKGFWDNRKGA
ncbi:hypothetical protein JCM11491_005968 [Sporobolomyces phaffii]